MTTARPSYDQLVARTCDRQLPSLAREREIIWVVLASLARGGAERIVLDWLRSALADGHAVRLAVQTTLPDEWPVPGNIPVLRREGGHTAFMHMVAARARCDADRIFTHLVRDEYLEILWARGLAVIPTVHNATAGWRNDPALWRRRGVPFAIAVSEAIAAELGGSGCGVPVVVIRHRPRVSPAVFSMRQRQAVRDRYRVAEDELFIGMIGSFKAQKNYTRALAVLDALRGKRKAKMLIAGGYGDAAARRLMLEFCREGARRGLRGMVVLAGVVDIETVMPAFDAVLNTSDFEGLSIATQEALYSNMPVVASRVGGQAEIDHPRLTLVPADDVPAYVAALARCEIRTALAPDHEKAVLPTSRLWTLAALAPVRRPRPGKCLFLTANLNAGGAQRSLVNLATSLAGRLDFAVAVTGTSTHPYFGDMLVGAGIKAFRPCESRNVLDIAEALFACIAAEGFATLVFWNLDPKLKLLLRKFLPHHRIVDVSPGHDAFLEMDNAAPFQKALAFTQAQYHAALDAMVLKYTTSEAPADLRHKLHRISNGVPTPRLVAPSRERKLVVQGRIAPSKRLDLILAAMPLVRRHVDCTLHIYGQAEARATATLDALLAQAATMKDYVFFHGAKPDLAASLGEFDGAIVLGTHQGCPNAVLEALAAGVPVVANDSGGTRELVIDGHTGILTAEQVTVESLAEAIVALLTLDRVGMRARACEHALTFSMDAMCARYLTLLNEEDHELDPAVDIRVPEQDRKADLAQPFRGCSLPGRLVPGDRPGALPLPADHRDPRVAS